MKKLFFIFLIIIFTNNAYASNWLLLNTSSKENGAIANGKTYIDTDSIKKIGGYVYAWGMIDLDETTDNFSSGGFSVLSVKFYDQIQCDIGRVKRLNYTFYNGNYGTGRNITDVPKDPEWSYVAPGTIEETIKNFACKNYMDD